ncbi:hypothetical protein CI109_103658 [Kwoniella shandongensis]|uniref:Uncharacterized protein n=1 Tax=Kwoniella shandongensis TaxID=1734106 RepID=A0AAJ8LL02_9TREE
MRLLFWQPTPASPQAFKGKPLPLEKASWLSIFFFSWVGDVMKMAYSRSVDADDLYTITPDLACGNLGDQVEAQFMRRMPPSRRPAHYQEVAPNAEDAKDNSKPITQNKCGNHGDQVGPDFMNRLLSSHRPAHYQAIPLDAGDLEDISKPVSQKKVRKIASDNLAIENGVEYDMSLLKAMLLTVWPQLLLCFAIKTPSQIMRTLAPIVTKLLLTQLSLSYAWHNAAEQGLPTDGLEPPKPAGYMYGLAIAIWVMTGGSSLVNWFPDYYNRLAGRKLRTAVMTMISRKSFRLSQKARVEMTNGRLTTMLSVDCGTFEAAANNLQEVPLTIIMLALGIGLVISLLGKSALVGLAVLLLDAPTKAWMVKRIAKLRKDQSKVIDVRVRLLSEILHNIRAIKLYAYEAWFGKRISDLRQQELHKLSHNKFTKTGMDAYAQFIPYLATILSFITYRLTGHALDPTIIFPTLQYYVVLRQPIGRLRYVISSLTEVMVSIRRIEKLLKAEEMQSALIIKHDHPHSIDVEGDFQYESTNQDQASEDGKGAPENATKVTQGEQHQKQPFLLKDIHLKVPKGALVCIVGRVGTGKTSLLSGMVKEMKQTTGHAIFGGKVSYVPQKAWVQSGSIQDNITFSSEENQVHNRRLEHIIDACALRHDVNMWPDGTRTLIGERGITLSGGQRQRICIARAAYQESDIVLLDDSLSAVDAHVGHHLLQNCILQGPMANRTRILVTHQLDVLPLADLVLVMDRDEDGDGRIVQQGTFNELNTSKGVFQDLIQNYGSTSADASQVSGPVLSPVVLSGARNDSSMAAEKSIDDLIRKSPKAPAAKLYLEEERAQGATARRVYIEYARSVGSWSLLLFCAYTLVLTQVAQVYISVFLGYWSEQKFDGWSQGAYMGVYAGLGVAMTLFNWASKFAMFSAGKRASYDMFNKAWTGVMSSPLSWHDRTPTGRIISRLSSDIALLDAGFAATWTQLIYCCLNILGIVVLILYTYPWVALLILPVVMFSCLCTAYYTQTSRDVKRLTSVLRSDVYVRFGEQLSGLPVIRAFGEQDRFIKHLEYAVDAGNVAYLCGPFTQPYWMGVRLSASTYLSVLLVTLFGVLERNNVSPAKFGVVFTYLIGTVTSIYNIVDYGTTAEQQMNNVERIQYYMSLESEAEAHLPSDPRPDEPWPTLGEVSFKSVQMRYRPDLPLVLKGVDFTIRPGEKVGIIGRTGAGKSSIAQAMFRTVEICGGKIEVDGVDLQSIGLTTPRERLATIPQDSFLFGGPVRENINPTGCHTDAELNMALALIHHNPNASHSLRDKFHLDVVVDNEGANFSAGEQQLLALVRALVKGSKVLLLDEATSSVDPETDALIQRIIQTEFANITLISIAHRLQTVAYYDRIMVMDAGTVVEFDSPLVLFDKPHSQFRLLCDKKNITKAELLRIREGASKQQAFKSV